MKKIRNINLILICVVAGVLFLIGFPSIYGFQNILPRGTADTISQSTIENIKQDNSNSIGAFGMCSCETDECVTQPPPEGSDCPNCKSPKIYDPYQKKCTCPISLRPGCDPLSFDQNCKFEGINPDCICEQGYGCAALGLVWDEESCSCVSCGEKYHKCKIFNPDKCPGANCDKEAGENCCTFPPCPEGFKLNKNNCRCEEECESPEVEDGQGGCICPEKECKSPKSIDGDPASDSYCDCICPSNPEGKCEDGFTFKAEKCECVCDKDCGDKKLDESTCTCYCPKPDDCENWDYDKCECNDEDDCDPSMEKCEPTPPPDPTQPPDCDPSVENCDPTPPPDPTTPPDCDPSVENCDPTPPPDPTTPPWPSAPPVSR